VYISSCRLGAEQALVFQLLTNEPEIQDGDGIYLLVQLLLYNRTIRASDIRCNIGRYILL
jgi:hypothetical protein